MKVVGGIDLRIWTRLICLVVSAAALWLIFTRVDFREMIGVFGRLQLAWFAAAIGCFGVSLVFAAWRWHLMLRLVGTTVHPLATLRAVAIGHFFNTLLLGPAGGDLAKSALYGRWYRHPVPSVIASSFLDRILGGAGTIAFVLVGVALAAAGGLFSVAGILDFSQAHFWIGAALLMAVLGGGFWARRTFRPESGIVRTLNAFVEGILQLKRTPWPAFKGCALSFVVQVTYSGVQALCLQAVASGPLPWATLLWAFPVIAFVSGIPISVAGAGIREGASLVLLGMVGVPEADAVAASLLVLTVFLLWAAISGLVWGREERRFRRNAHRPNPRTVSIVIPTLNEAESLGETIRCARALPEVEEIIVADGGSTDATAALAKDLGCRVVSSPKGRGAQMRAGAAQARGDVVLLLHADTWVRADAGQALLNCLRDVTVVGGGFWKTFRDPSPLMLGSRFRCLLRLCLAGRVLGDQGLFVRRDSLEAIGGVPDLPLMEEFELCRRLRKIGRLALAGSTVITSTRRFEKRGVVRTYLRMGRVMLQYYLGTPAHKLRALYERD